MTSGWAWFAAWLVGYRQVVMAGWVFLALALAPIAADVKEKLSVAATVPGSESAQVEQLIAGRFTSGFAKFAVLVVTGAPPPGTAAGKAALIALRDSLLANPFVSGTFSYLDGGDSLFVGPRGQTFLVVGLDRDSVNANSLVPSLRSVTSRVAALAPGTKFGWTGEIPLNHDLRSVSAEDAESAERRVIPLTLLLLVIAFGAVGAATLPLLAGGLAITVALGAAVVISGVWPLSILLQNVVTMLGLGLGIDYALLVVGRFRQGLAHGLDSSTAAARAADTAGRTIVLSGATVAIGFVALMLIPVNEIRSIAVGGLLVVIVAVLLSIPLLPAVLATVGNRVNWGTFRRRRAGKSAERWRAWGRVVCRHPLLVLAIAAFPVAALAWQATRLSS